MQSSQPKVGTAPPAGAAVRAATRGNVFRREGEYWTMRYNGTVIRLRHTKGLRYLAVLLRQPGERIAARDLVGAETDCVLRNADRGTDDTQHSTLDNPKSAIDERARLAVTKRIKSVVHKIEDHHPPLGYHLKMTIKTGAHCSYHPDPQHPICWTT